MVVSAQLCLACTLLLAHVPRASAQEVTENSISAVPLLSTPKAKSDQQPAPGTGDFEALQDQYQEAYENWAAKVIALSKQKSFSGTWPENPDLRFYPRFRGLANFGDIQARLWCLEHFSYDTVDHKYQKIRWQGEAFSLATALCNDVALSSKLRQSLNAARVFDGVDTIDKVLGYLQEITAVEEIKRATMAYRSELWLEAGRPRDEFLPNEIRDAKNTEQKRGRELAEEIFSTWPNSKEAVRLAGLCRAADTLILGGMPTDFTGTDVDGRKLRLSDYRGKVVVLDFWGFW